MKSSSHCELYCMKKESVSIKKYFILFSGDRSHGHALFFINTRCHLSSFIVLATKVLVINSFDRLKVQFSPDLSHIEVVPPCKVIAQNQHRTKVC